jgi:hypothetical protein
MFIVALLEAYLTKPINKPCKSARIEGLTLVRIQMS